MIEQLFAIAIFPIGSALLAGGALMVVSRHRSGARIVAADAGFNRHPVLLAVGVGSVEVALGVLMVVVGIIGPSKGSRLLGMLFINPMYVLVVVVSAALAYLSFSGAIVGLDEEKVSLRTLLRRGRRYPDAEQEGTPWRSSLRPGGGLFMVVNGVFLSLAGIWLTFMAFISS